MKLTPSASQTVGPFFNFGLTANTSQGIMARDGALGRPIRLRFEVVDGDGVPTPGDSMIELWQADAAGHYGGSADPHFNGFGRLETTAQGVCTFDTVIPGAADGAPHINVTVFARGLLKQLVTRVYFEGAPSNAADPVLALVPADRRATLMAHRSPDDPNLWTMQIRLQGEGETVFFDV